MRLPSCTAAIATLMLIGCGANGPPDGRVLSDEVPILQLSPMNFTGAVLYLHSPSRALPSTSAFPMTMGFQLPGASTPRSITLAMSDPNGSTPSVRLIRENGTGDEARLIDAAVGVIGPLSEYTIAVPYPRQMSANESITLQIWSDGALQVGNVILR